MPFGVQCASNIAQGRDHLLVHLVRHVMDEMEAAAELLPVEVRWLHARRAALPAPAQTRLYYAEMFTDDMASAILGERRCVR